MQVSKSKLQKETEEKMFLIFFQTMADLKDINEASSFLNDFLTKTEKISLAKRLMIAYLLESGRSYKYIKNNIRVSSATIANVDKMMAQGNKGFTLALKKIIADEWANQTVKKVSKLVNNIIGK